MSSDLKQFLRVCGNLFAVWVAILLLSSGCGSGSRSGEVKATQDDNGKEVELWTGQVLVVVLKGNPTTGYMWAVAEIDKGILRQQGEVEVEPDAKPAPNAVGSPMTMTYRFETVKPGVTGLTLAYRRPWEKKVNPMSTYSLKVIVH